MKKRKWLFTPSFTVLLFALLLNPPSRSSRRACSNATPSRRPLPARPAGEPVRRLRLLRRRGRPPSRRPPAPRRHAILAERPRVIPCLPPRPLFHRICEVVQKRQRDLLGRLSDGSSQ